MINEIRKNSGLTEEWTTTQKNNAKEDIDIFINPSKKDFTELGGTGSQVRFIVDLKAKKAYVFDSSLLHYLACEELDIPYEPSDKNSKYVYHYGKIMPSKGKLKVKINTDVVPKSFEFIHNQISEIRKDDTLNKYFF
ncbi:MAG: hypothetical protein ACOC1O_01430 [bacterium]